MINEHIEIGEINTLKINRDTEPGLFLEALDGEVVLLPNAYVTDDMEVGDEIDVFVYVDSEDRDVATTEEPLGYVNEFISTRVIDTMPMGAFVDLGLKKDLFVPKNKQKTPFTSGETRIVRIVLDEKTNRLIGVEKITSFLTKEIKELKINDEVKLLIFAKTPLGYKVIVNNSYEGLIYANEIFTKIQVGKVTNGYVKTIRDDGKLDISLQPIGKDNASDINTTKILNLLKSNDGTLPYNYKTDPEVVKKVFAISKKAYKRALTTLVNENKIIINEETISLK
ncbi:MAG: S1-like domain-containing RNA-binding protein [Campylobacterota bacterium]|nr:S1-like domain-containing RNA-binding protein [Campylobacterota bacterium]